MLDEVGSLFIPITGSTLTQKFFRKTKSMNYIYPIYSSQTINDGIIGWYNNWNFSNVMTYTKDGYAGVTRYRNHKFFATSHCGIIKTKVYEGNECFAHIIDSITYKHIVKSVIPSISISVMKEIKITYTPNIQEQQKISKLIQLLDKHIDLKQKQLDKYKNIKNGLLNKMFC